MLYHIEGKQNHIAYDISVITYKYIWNLTNKAPEANYAEVTFYPGFDQLYLIAQTLTFCDLFILVFL